MWKKHLASKMTLTLIVFSADQNKLMSTKLLKVERFQFWFFRFFDWQSNTFMLSFFLMDVYVKFLHSSICQNDTLFTRKCLFVKTTTWFQSICLVVNLTECQDFYTILSYFQVHRIGLNPMHGQNCISTASSCRFCYLSECRPTCFIVIFYRMWTHLTFH